MTEKRSIQRLAIALAVTHGPALEFAHVICVVRSPLAEVALPLPELPERAKSRDGERARASERERQGERVRAHTHETGGVREQDKENLGRPVSVKRGLVSVKTDLVKTIAESASKPHAI